MNQPGDPTPAIVPPAALRVLLVEDDPGDAFLVSELLADTPIEVEHRTNIAEASARLTESPRPDCILLDLGLPDAMGLEALSGVRAVDPDTPIVVLTGDVAGPRGLEAVTAGAQDYLVKSAVDEDLLSRSIRYAVQRHRTEIDTRSLRDAQLWAEENRRLERGLLPTPLVDDPRLCVGSRYVAGRRRALLGGDFYDAAQTPDGMVHAVLGDVSGHGPDEAALGVALRLAWRALLLADTPIEKLHEVLEQVLIHERHDDFVYATLVTVCLDLDTSRLSLRLFGHPAPIIIGADGQSRIIDEVQRRTPLGVGDPVLAPMFTVDLDPGDAVVLYSDGLLEARVATGAGRLGDDALVEAMATQAELLPGWRDTPAELAFGVVAAVEEINAGPLTDDAAMLVLAQRPAAT